MNSQEKMKTLMQQKKGRRLLLFPLPLQGHITPMLQLANILHSKGFSITIIHTHFNSPNQFNYPQFTFEPISDGLSENDASTIDVLALISLLNSNCVEPFRDCLARLLSEVAEEPFACLITDAVWYFTQAVVDSLKLPRIVIHTTSVCSFLAFAALPLLREKGYLPKQDSEFEAPVLELPPLKVKDIPIIKTRNPEDVYKVTGRIIRETKSASGLIWNSFRELEQPELAKLAQEFPIPSFSFGPFHKHFPASSSSLQEQDQSSISWLNSQAPKAVIYVSFGSVATMDETGFSEVAWGLANSMQPFLWVVRPGLVSGSEWLEPLPNGFLETVGGRGHIVKWSPQQKVLAHPAIGGFWTHSGWNPTLESICEGVPMICSPDFGDQMVNSRYVNDVWKVGLKLEKGLKRGEIERTIRRVMVEKEGEEIRQRMMGLKEEVNLCLKKGGSSYQSLEGLTDYILSL
ncbi:unnamed protein product [Ilex paraguariensis]|uniref:Uncharacterized protein n=1 Tax=Ilex paraguariensis TaxID=185542 RepID=A0ABC8T751_9AQUA